MKDEIRIHTACGSEVVELIQAEITYCMECECIAEGESEYISIEEFEGIQNG